MLNDWYAEQARDLPWRRPSASPWAILVSEVMLQQTPVARVEPVWRTWLQRWPTPADLAAEPSGEAVRAWGRLGYPRRALRLHACATVITRQHDGEVPRAVADLLTLPGVGDYTAAAVAAFAFGQRTAVVDTNVRRVLARALTGRALPASSLTARETALAWRALPADRDVSVRWNVAVMELGALICTARSPACPRCPVRDRCAWFAAGSPAYDGPPRPGQAWNGTDRQCRGRLLQVLREHDGAVPSDLLNAAWRQDTVQRDRCLAALVDEGLIQRSSTPQPGTPPGTTQQSAPQDQRLQGADWYGFAVT
ncbi:MAG: A/G-specific adenine glycosylase [Ornithinimicrobium sp.]